MSRAASAARTTAKAAATTAAILSMAIIAAGFAAAGDDPPADPGKGAVSPVAKKDVAPPAAFGQVSGSVSTPSRRSVRGASVALIPDGTAEIYGASTGEDGRYALTNLANGMYAVLVMDPGGSVLRKERVSVRPLFRNIVDFTTEPAGVPPPHIPILPPSPDVAPPASLEISGRLITVEGQPISEAWVTFGPMGIEAPALRARTDAEGRFRLLRVQAGYFRVTARAIGHVTWSMGPLFLEAARDLSMRLTLLPFPLGQPMNPEDLLVPTPPIAPEVFEKEPSP